MTRGDQICAESDSPQQFEPQSESVHICSPQAAHLAHAQSCATRTRAFVSCTSLVLPVQNTKKRRGCVIAGSWRGLLDELAVLGDATPAAVRDAAASVFSPDTVFRGHVIRKA